jgi:hypothetical protein
MRVTFFSQDNFLDYSLKIPSTHANGKGLMWLLNWTIQTNRKKIVLGWKAVVVDMYITVKSFVYVRKLMYCS